MCKDNNPIKATIDNVQECPSARITIDAVTQSTDNDYIQNQKYQS